MVKKKINILYNKDTKSTINQINNLVTTEINVGVNNQKKYIMDLKNDNLFFSWTWMIL